MSSTHWMQHAITLAKRARDAGEVPIGAVIVHQGKVIGEGWNQPISTQDPTAHAEIIALRHAAKAIANYRILEAEMYVTLEPCPMCASALLHARLGKLYYGATDSRAGAVGSVVNLLIPNLFNHTIEHQGGILAEPCAHLLREFFKARR